MERCSEKNINLSVDVDLWKKVGIHASKNDTTKKDIVDKALKQYLGLVKK